MPERIAAGWRRCYDAAKTRLGKKSLDKAWGSQRSLILFAVAVIGAAGAIGYNVLGSRDPSTGDPAAAAPASIEQLRALAEASPDDARAWQELGFAHFERGEYADAALAYERAVAIDGGEAALWSALGEARVMASERDPMPPAALEAFRKAGELDPRDPRTRYFLGVQKDLEQDHEGAIASWVALLADTPPGAPWERDLIRTIEQVGKINGIEVETRIASAMSGRVAVPQAGAQGLPGPTQQQLAAAGSISPNEQRKMAEGMVARLEQRLRDDPSNLDGWVMLMRGRMTLGEPDRAKTALDAAVRANPGAATRLRGEAVTLGIR